MAGVINEKLQSVGIDKVRPHPANPRQGDVGAIYESIEANGFYGALVVQKSTGHILAGNHRWMAAREAGLDAVPVIYVDVDDERAMRILLADNRTNDLAAYDNESLAQLLEHLASTDDGLTGTGYDGDALDELLDGLNMPAEDEWGAAIGDLPDGDKSPFQQMTFTLHDTQAERVNAAIAKAKEEADGFIGSPNENSNGNALDYICRAFVNG